MDTSTLLILLVIAFCVILFVKVSKSIIKVLIIVGAIAFIVVKYLPQFL